MRETAMSIDSSGLSTKGLASCLLSGMDLHAYRRESDRIPFGVECALPGLPAPSRPALRPQPKKSVLKTLGYLLLTIVFILCTWQLGRGIYILFKAPVAQGTVGKKA